MSKTQQRLTDNIDRLATWQAEKTLDVTLDGRCIYELYSAFEDTYAVVLVPEKDYEHMLLQLEIKEVIG